MNILRTIAGIVVGGIVAMIVIAGIEFVSFVMYAPDDGRPLLERMQEMEKDPQKGKEWIQTLPLSAMVLVLAAWQAGAFLGGVFSAWIAGRARLIHAGIIGVMILAGTIVNARNMQQQYDFYHPEWMLISGLLLPIPMSLLGGLLVSMLRPTQVPSASST